MNIINPDFCTTVLIDEYDYLEQFTESIKAANKFHKKMHEECPPPYYPLDMGKVRGLLVAIDDMKSALAPFIRLAQNMRDAIDGLPDDMETTIGGGDAQITVGDLRRLLEVKA